VSHVEFGVPYNASMVDRNISRRRNIRHLAKKSRILRAVESMDCRIAQFPCPNLSEKFALMFWCFRLGEFLEARIVPERIEHRIEPEQRGSER